MNWRHIMEPGKRSQFPLVTFQRSGVMGNLNADWTMRIGISGPPTWTRLYVRQPMPFMNTAMKRVSSFIFKLGPRFAPQGILYPGECHYRVQIRWILRYIYYFDIYGPFPPPTLDMFSVARTNRTRSINKCSILPCKWGIARVLSAYSIPELIDCRRQHLALVILIDVRIIW